MKQTLSILILCTSIFGYTYSRSIHRPYDPLMPEIITRWVDENTCHHLRDYWLEEYALFKTFDKDYFMSHLLPDGPIKYRNEPNKTVDGCKIKALTQNLLLEIYQRKKKFKDFEVLKNRDFNSITLSGVLVLKFKDYDFTLKLFIETPETFVKPFSKGWQPACFHVMGGGINRYLSGFTRIKNLDAIKKRLAESPYWSSKIDTLDKWFILPDNIRWFEVRGRNIGRQQNISIQLPSAYAVVTYFVKKERVLSISSNKDRALGLQIAHYFGDGIDPHIDNFVVEKKTGKIVMVDTEHFPTMVGLKEPLYFNSYPSWYTQLTCKFLKDKFFRSKAYRRRLQTHPTVPVALPG